MLDTRLAIETPEGVDLALRAASPAARSLAWLIDGMIRFALLMVASNLLAPLLGIGAFLIATFAVWWLYGVIFEVWLGGATPGKRALGLRVVHDDGTPVALGASVLRNLLRVADFLPFAYGLGLITSLFHPRFKRLGDIVAGTLVVHVERVSDSLTEEQVEAAPPSIPLRLEEQRALVEFSVRAAALGAPRSGEFAALLTPLTGASDPARGVVRLKSIAAWLRRRG
ncbi:MAG: RDD family protein [Acidobacteriota bacterium]